MKRTMDKVIIITILSGLASGASALDHWYQGISGAPTVWEDAGNWSSGIVPGAGDNVYIDNAGWIEANGYPVLSSTTTIGTIFVGMVVGDPTVATLGITASGNLTTTGAFGLFIGVANDAAVTSAGTVNTGTGQTVLSSATGGNATLNITGGSYTTRWLSFEPTTVNHVQLDDGTFTVDGITSLHEANATFEITDGTLVLLGDHTAEVNWWSDGLGLTGHGDGANIRSQLIDGNTHVISLGGLTPTELYGLWADGYGLTNAITGDLMADPDGDLIDNLTEYALGGDPTNSNDRGYLPISVIEEVDGTNSLLYVYVERADKDFLGLSYYCERTLDLTNPAWTTNGISFLDTAILSADFNITTNYVLVEGEGKQFIKLQIEL